MTSRADLAKRRERALSLAVAGIPIGTIAEQLGVSVATARKDLAAALNASTAAATPALEMERLEAMERATWAVLRRPRGAPDDATSLAAVDTLLRIHEQRSRAQLFADAIAEAQAAAEEAEGAED